MAQEGYEEVDGVEATKRTSAKTTANDGFLQQRTVQLPPYHLHLALAVEAALVYARPKMPKRVRAKFLRRIKTAKRMMSKQRCASFVLLQ